MRHPSKLCRRYLPSQTNPFHILNSKFLKTPSNIFLTLTPRFSVIFSFTEQILCAAVIGVTWLGRVARGSSGGKRGQKTLQCCFYLRNYFCYWVKGGRMKIRNKCERIMWGKGTKNEARAFKRIVLISETCLLCVLLMFITARLPFQVTPICSVVLPTFAFPSYAHMFCSLTYVSPSKLGPYVL